MIGKFFTWPKLLIIFVAIIVVLIGVWYVNSSLIPSDNNSFPTPTPTLPTSSPIQSATAPPNPSPSPSSSITPSPSASTNPPTPTSTASSPPTSAPTPTPASPTPAPPTTIVFNFDNGSPTLSVRQPTPFDQTSNGVTAHFSSPTDSLSRPSFSVQNLNSLASSSIVINSAKFSGLFLWPSTINRDHLDINFSVSITSITFVFKTAELHDPGPGGTGSPIRLTAYMNSPSAPVGSPVTANGVETQFDNYPEGTLTFNPNGQSFNMVEIDLPYISAEGATGFIIDNITVITA